jgi:hypothetical protein
MINYPIEEGQMVRITVDNEIAIEGPCVNREPARVGDYITMTYKIASIKSLFYKIPIDARYAIDTDYSDIIEDCCHDEMGVIPGNIDTSNTLSEALNTDSQSKGQILDTLAGTDVKDWWVNYDDFTLDFSDDFATTEDAPYELDTEFGTWSDYRDVVVTSNYDNYNNSVTIIGKDYDGVILRAFAQDKNDYDSAFAICGYDAALAEVVNDSNIFFKPLVKLADDMGAYTTTPSRIVDYYDYDTGPSINIDDIVYNKTRDKYTFVSRVLANGYTFSIFDVNPAIPGQVDGDIIHYNYEFSAMAKDRARANGGHPKQNIKFTTSQAGFKIRQRLWFNDPKLGVSKLGAIVAVDIEDRGAGETEYTITVESKTKSYFNVIKNSENYMKFFRGF